MGMSSDSHENLSFAEQIEMEKRERERAKKVEVLPQYITIGRIEIFNEPYLLLVGEDKKWYKAKFLKDIQISPTRNTPKFPVYDTENITPVTKDEFYSYFKRA